MTSWCWIQGLAIKLLHKGICNKFSSENKRIYKRIMTSEDWGSEMHSELRQVSKTKLFAKRVQLKAVNCFHKRTPSWVFDWILNSPKGLTKFRWHYIHEVTQGKNSEYSFKNSLLLLLVWPSGPLGIDSNNFKLCPAPVFW